MTRPTLPLRFAVTLALAMAVFAPLSARAEEPKKENTPMPDAKPWHAGLKIEPATIGSTPRLTTFGGKVYFAGQPKEEDLKAFAEKGVKLVINLRTPGEMKFDEKAAVEAAGMKYLSVPIGAEDPPDAELEKALNALDDAKSRPVLLHCASSNRVGYVWAALRGTRHGLTEPAAMAEGKEAGLSKPNEEARARKYIERKKAEPAPAKKP